ncbi:AraC family transcriptional regulator [Lysobacter enzymogenes]|uniref:helix-turn-helix transcriptional regulator n=1 Tax=Lysobacter enzymogenes TaxID=69 RepID=UPI00374849E4
MPKRQTAAAAPDPLATAQDEVFFQVFRLARLHGELLGDGPLRAGAGRRYGGGRAMFHFVREAACEATVEPLPGARGRSVRLRLQPDELLILPHGHAHRIALPARGAAAELTSGVFAIEGVGGEALMRALPPTLHARSAACERAGADGAAQWLALTFAAMRKETREPSIGSRIMLARLIDMVFIWSVRHWLASAPPGPPGWLGALRDPLVGRALALLHAEPAHAWSVEALAARLHQSRSGLAQRFAREVGEPPMRYLGRWRMQLAADALARSHLLVAQVAERVGYASEAALARSFRREFGMSPSQYRASARERGGAV